MIDHGWTHSSMSRQWAASEFRSDGWAVGCIRVQKRSREPGGDWLLCTVMREPVAGFRITVEGDGSYSSQDRHSSICSWNLEVKMLASNGSAGENGPGTFEQ